MIVGTYPEVRSHIADGDLVAVRSRHGMLPNLTRLITGWPYTHTAIALWLDGGLWIVEMRRGGNVSVQLSQRANEDFDVFDCRRKSIARWRAKVCLKRCAGRSTTTPATWDDRPQPLVRLSAAAAGRPPAGVQRLFRPGIP